MLKRLGIALLITLTTSVYANGMRLPNPPAYPKSMQSPAPAPLTNLHPFQMTSYFGITAGYSKLDEGDRLSDIFDHSFKHSKVAGGGFIGFRFKPYMAVDLGYLYFMQNRYNDGSLSAVKVNLHAIHADLKLIIPLSSAHRGYAPVELFASGGAAYVFAKYELPSSLGVGKSRTNDALRPLASVGVSVHFSPLVSMDFTYTRIFGKDKLTTSNIAKNIKKTIPNGSLYSISFVFSGPVDLL